MEPTIHPIREPKIGPRTRTTHYWVCEPKLLNVLVMWYYCSCKVRLLTYVYGVSIDYQKLEGLE